MCISLPAKVISVDGQSAQVETNGTQRTVILATEDAQAGDWVLVYSGIALNKMTPDEAEETLRLLAQLRNTVT